MSSSKTLLVRIGWYIKVHMLEKSFEEDNKLEPERKTQLAKKLGLQQRQVAVWFQNRRARWKTKQLERDYDQLKCSYDSLASDYDNILKENQKLKSEVVSLTEKLQAKEDPLPVDAAHVPAMQFTMKVEDRLSMDSGESAVVDENGPQLVDGCDSYLPSEYYPGCVATPLEGIQSEDDDGSDDGRSYFSNAFVATEEQHRGEGETLGWWVWS
ncbi:unnamed protein product [Ilex paraguariensis]|uniref:Homeobox-leucine zipper protein n=1 Tax=Ilex paraguariensis TaxID=185542 RepID=A0ABC8SZL4_9AQUA